jgi:hypothetical protein
VLPKSELPRAVNANVSLLPLPVTTSQFLSNARRSSHPVPVMVLTEVGAFYWTALAPDVVNLGREEQSSILL